MFVFHRLLKARALNFIFGKKEALFDGQPSDGKGESRRSEIIREKIFEASFMLGRNVNEQHEKDKAVYLLSHPSKLTLWLYISKT